MKTTTFTAEAFTFMISIVSNWDTLINIGLALAPSSKFSVLVTSKWGRYTLKMEIEGEEAQSIIQMALRGSMTAD